MACAIDLLDVALAYCSSMLDGGRAYSQFTTQPLCFWTGADGGSSDGGDEEPPSMDSRCFPRIEVMSVPCLVSC
jgi:hypothetical protein